MLYIGLALETCFGSCGINGNFMIENTLLQRLYVSYICRPNGFIYVNAPRKGTIFSLTRGLVGVDLVCQLAARSLISSPTVESLCMWLQAFREALLLLSCFLIFCCSLRNYLGATLNYSVRMLSKWLGQGYCLHSL